MSDLSKYDVTMATHLLRCAHQLGHNRREYNMPCIVLGRTKSGKMKIVVFGDRGWARKDDVKRIRYVSVWRLRKQ